MPSLERLHRQFSDQPFVLLAIDIGEKRDTVNKLLEEKGYSFTTLLDEDSFVANLYGIRSHPMKFLIDKNGDLLGYAPGYREWYTSEMQNLIQLLTSKT